MKKEQGITLIALVVTIVVLLILAAVSISMLTGENGIIKRASEAKDETEQARVEELVGLAVNSLIGENNGSTNGITPQMVAEEVNEMENRDDIYAEGSEFPTKIIFPEEGREVEVNLEQKEDSNEMYEVAVNEEDIAPMDLFDYEIIDEAEMGTLTLSALPTKKARIIRIKEEYCNSYQSGDSNTNYEIIYEGTKISDTLIIPYQVELDGEMYTITEVNLYAMGVSDYNSDYYSFPEVETVIYPNTIEKIDGNNPGEFENQTLKTVILSNKLKTIGEEAFRGCINLSNITIPESVTTIESMAFLYCSSLSNIIISDSVSSIGEMAFAGCEVLTNITIPDNVISIGNEAFRNCRRLTSITIPESVTNMGESVFAYWTSSQTINVPFREGEKPEGWSENWNSDCNATINYLK